MKNNSIVTNEHNIKGTVHKITYRNDKNGYTVAVVHVGRENITAVGTMPFLSAGESASFEGDFVIHPVFGKQFSVKRYEQKTPESTAAILKYLSSGAIRGVGQSTAIKIVERFGNQSLSIIENHPEELSSISGISLSKAMAISDEYKSQFSVRDISILLSPYGISPDTCVKTYKKLGSDCAKRIKENPYILCDNDLGISFETIERIAYDFDIPADSQTRLFAGIEYILTANLLNGHTCLPKKKLLSVAVKLLQIDYYRLDDICNKMVTAFRLTANQIGEDIYLSLPDYFYAEDYISARIKLSISKNTVQAVDELEIDAVENKLGIKFHATQRQAIKLALSENIMILTGGPGTGKTTAINGIIQLFARRNADIILAAPTGRAAKRMTEITGRDAKTIHRLLDAEWVDGTKTRFARNERNPLPCDVLIVDESSMLDTMLLEALLRATKTSCKIIFVGDADQLPSIAAGNILSDLVKSNAVPTVALHKVFRQSNNSLIVRNAHSIINNETPDLSDNSNDFFFIQKNNSADVISTVLELCRDRLPQKYGFDPLSDIQVLCPSRKFETGSINVNSLLQQALNSNIDFSPKLSYKGLLYCKGDKVMQTKNNYDIQWEKQNGENGFGVFNGDIGYITDIDISSHTVKVCYDDKSVMYASDNLSEIEPAYAVTVHKSQGSEFECVVMPLFAIPNKLAYRNLLYTAVTRAKKLFIAVGDKLLFLKMCANDKKTLRYTLLKELLVDNVNK